MNHNISRRRCAHASTRDAREICRQELRKLGVFDRETPGQVAAELIAEARGERRRSSHG